MHLKIVQIRQESEDVLSLELRHPGGNVPDWEPGSHIDVVLPSGIVRQYSLCGPLAVRDFYRIAVLKEKQSRGGSWYVHDSLRVGEAVEIRGPRNNFRFRPARNYIFIAGGIGITPILPMVEQAEADGACWTLYYFGRSYVAMSFVEQLRRYGDKVRLLPSAERRDLTIDAILGGATDSEIYCCGPHRLIDAVSRACEAMGIAEQCHVERFAPVTTGLPDEACAFTAVIASTGESIEIPADRSLLHCLLDVGADVLFSCEEGTCGSCMTRVLEGTPLHRDSVLTPSEKAANDKMMICVSRSLSDRLVLDL